MSVQTALKDEEARGTIAARVSIILVALMWGFNWVAAKYVLRDLSPWTFRTVSFGCSAAVLLGIAKWSGIGLRLKNGRARVHVAVAGVLNMGGFGILSAFAQLGTTTSRTAICVFTMPIWVALMARLVLREHLDRWRCAALALGAGGLVVLLGPLLADGVPVGALFALGSALSWAAGTVYLKWARVEAHPIAVAGWQLAAGTASVMIGLAATGVRTDAGLHLLPMLALVYSAMIGSALAYVLWFRALARQPASTASLGTLLVPVIGVLASAAVLGDRPSAADLEGFALILAAAVCALAPRAAQATPAPA